MTGENQLQNKSWIHVLGTNEFETAVMLTARQRSINRHINPNLRISFDTSTPFRLLVWKNLISIPKFLPDSLTVGTDKMPEGKELVGSTIRFPWPSPLGDKMILGDLVISPNKGNGSFHDTQSSHLIAHHNLATLCYGIALVNRVYDAESIRQKYTIDKAAGAAIAAIDEVIASQSMTMLAKHQRTFANLRHGIAPTSDDEERDL
jgi:hypothetical protein